ncbi:PAH [Bugula neritina]|uniref:phenylalanine 4-monooxygenase n=1 Tax=Bugula neritina TaxID=10212 RepID=A0A7J7K6R8_BUGNE|nr:PAH [Bugula neritina]
MDASIEQTKKRRHDDDDHDHDSDVSGSKLTDSNSDRLGVSINIPMIIAIQVGAEKSRRGSNFVDSHDTSDGAVDATDNSITLIFSVAEGVGALAQCLKIFKNNSINLSHIESRPGTLDSSKYEFLVEIKDAVSKEKMKSAADSLRQLDSVVDLRILTRDGTCTLSSDSAMEVPWFPRRIRDLDRFANHILSYGSERHCILEMYVMNSWAMYHSLLTPALLSFLRKLASSAWGHLMTSLQNWQLTVYYLVLKLYWFTVEFGLCRQNGKLKAFGAGLLSSFGELEYCLSDKPKIKDFEPQKVCVQTYPITEYQPIYFAANSFEEAKVKLREWSNTIPRPFEVRYNAYTQSVEVLQNTNQVINLIKDIRGDMDLLHSSLSKLS